MTPQEQAKYQASVMIAFAEGKRIKHTVVGGSYFTETTNPVWDWGNYVYEVMPAEPKKVILEAWLINMTGQIVFYQEGCSSNIYGNWTRVQSLDLEYEVTD